MVGGRFLLVLAGALLGVSALHAEEVEPVELVELVDRPAPEFSLETLDGHELTREDLTGQVVVLNFWATWCKPCRQEIPELIALRESLHDRGLEIVGVNVGDGQKAASRFVRREGIPYPVALDDGLSDRLDVMIYPTSVLLDRTGRIRYVATGYPHEGPTLSKVVETLLEEAPPAANP